MLLTTRPCCPRNECQAPAFGLGQGFSPLCLGSLRSPEKCFCAQMGKEATRTLGPSPLRFSFRFHLEKGFCRSQESLSALSSVGRPGVQVFIHRNLLNRISTKLSESFPSVPSHVSRSDQSVLLFLLPEGLERVPTSAFSLRPGLWAERLVLFGPLSTLLQMSLCKGDRITFPCFRFFIGSEYSFNALASRIQLLPVIEEPHLWPLLSSTTIKFSHAAENYVQFLKLS